MSVSQISVFTESKPGHLLRVLDTFRDAGVSVRGYSISDTGDYGIARFVVDAPDAAASALKEAGFASNTNEVVCLELKDVPGELARILSSIAEAGINIAYSYSLISTYIVIASHDIAALERALSATDASMLSQADLA